jgi:hypothetical protein
MMNAFFTQIMDERRRAQRIFYSHPASMPLAASVYNGPHKMLIVIDTLAYFMNNFAKCPCFLMDCGEALGYRDLLPLQMFESYVTLLPFCCFLGILELHADAPPDIVPLPCKL